MKYVAVRLNYFAEGIDAFKVVDMHDEAQWECHQSETMGLEMAIIAAFKSATEDLNLRCPQEADVKVGMNWSETH